MSQTGWKLICRLCGHVVLQDSPPDECPGCSEWDSFETAEEGQDLKFFNQVK